MSRFLIFVIGGAALAAAGVTCAEPTEDDYQRLDDMFRYKIKAVQRTDETDDDAVLIEQMFDSAKTFPDSPGLQQLLYRRIMLLGVDAGLYEQVLQAAEQIREEFPDDPSGSYDRLVLIFDAGYLKSRGQAKAKLAPLYTDLLITAADRAAKTNRPERAGELLRRAMAVARSINSPKLAEIEQAVDDLAKANLQRARLDELERKVKSNPENQAAARDLVLGLLMYLDAPERAFDYVEMTRDPNLIDVVSFAVKGVDEVSPPEALRVADWYLSKARDAEDDRESKPLYEHAIAYYSAMLERYPREDALRDRVELMKRIADQELNRLFSE